LNQVITAAALFEPEIVHPLPHEVPGPLPAFTRLTVSMASFHFVDESRGSATVWD